MPEDKRDRPRYELAKKQMGSKLKQQSKERMGQRAAQEFKRKHGKRANPNRGA